VAALFGDARGQALVETALVLPLLLLLVFGVLGVHRVVRAQGAVDAVAREAARSGAASRSTQEALVRADTRGREVAVGYFLASDALDLAISPGRFDRSPGDAVRVTARCVVVLDDLPLLGWVRVPLSSSYAEVIDPYRSRFVP
jgi:hypothetical protein